LVGRFLAEQQPDVLCLQETKCHDGQFPLSDFRKFGYEHVVINGQKGYHGVAIVSRLLALIVIFLRGGSSGS
jgi:exodeoxyribonuclease-3